MNRFHTMKGIFYKMNKKKLINVRVREELAKDLARVARSLDVSVSHFVREAIKEKMSKVGRALNEVAS